MMACVYSLVFFFKSILGAKEKKKKVGKVACLINIPAMAQMRKSWHGSS